MNLRILLITVGLLVVLGMVAAVITYKQVSPAPAPQALTPEQRQQNAEHLIEVRSEHVKDTLDQTRDLVNQRQKTFDEAQQLAE